MALTADDSLGGLIAGAEFDSSKNPTLRRLTEKPKANPLAGYSRFGKSR